MMMMIVMMVILMMIMCIWSSLLEWSFHLSLLLFLTEQRILSHFLYLSLTSSLEDSLHLSTVFYSFTHLTENYSSTQHPFVRITLVY